MIKSAKRPEVMLVDPSAEVAENSMKTEEAQTEAGEELTAAAAAQRRRTPAEEAGLRRRHHPGTQGYPTRADDERPQLPAKTAPCRRAPRLQSIATLLVESRTGKKHARDSQSV